MRLFFTHYIFTAIQSAKFKLSLILLSIGLIANAQTVLISPTGDGGFETGTSFAANGWTVINNASATANNWAISNIPVTFAGSRCAHVTNNTASNPWLYTNTAPSTVHMYRDITVPSGESNINLSYQLKGIGESGFDRLLVYVAPTSVTPVLGTPATGTVLTGATLMFTQTTFVSTPYSNINVILPPSLAGTSFRLIFVWQNDGSGGVTPPVAVDNIGLTSAAPSTFSATTQGGLWSSPLTWVGGVVPPNMNNVIIPSGSTVTVDQAIFCNHLDINGTLQWGLTSFSATGFKFDGTAATGAAFIFGNITVGTDGRFLPYTTAPTGQTINIAGDLINNGYSNCAVTSTNLNFNGAVGSTLSGTGIFEGPSPGIGAIRAIGFQNLGSNTINTSQNLTITSGFNFTAGSVNTNGKLKIDNAVDVFNRPINTQVANLAVTTMGTKLTGIPFVAGSAITLWTNNATTAVNTLIAVPGDSNLYRVLKASLSIGPVAPTHTSGRAQNLQWIGKTGTLGNPLPTMTAVSVGTQYFYGSNLYTCVAVAAAAPWASAIADTNNPPIHLSGTVVSGGATFLYVGSPARAYVNFLATDSSVRSLTIAQQGSGYSSTPTIAFTQTNTGITGTAAPAASVVLFYSNLIGPANSLVQKTGGTIATGGITINSDQGTGNLTNELRSASGVGSITTAGGGVNYTNPPIVGFSGPTNINLITNQGSGYTSAPTITVSGGNLVSGVALVTGNFTINVFAGKVVSVYLNTGTTACYSIPPTLTLTGGAGTGAALSFPLNSWPAATAVIGANRQILGFNVTNSGFGYITAPTVGVGTVSGIAGSNGGTFTTVATAPTCRIGLYNLTLNFFAPSTVALTQADVPYVIPPSRKINVLSLGGNGNGLNLTDSLVLLNAAPLTLNASLGTTGNILDMGGKNLIFTSNTFTGAFSQFNNPSGSLFLNTYIKNGSVTFCSQGGAKTLNYPFAGVLAASSHTLFTGTGTLITGTDATYIKMTELGKPGNSVNIFGPAYAQGRRTYRVDMLSQFRSSLTSKDSSIIATTPNSIAPTIKLSCNPLDSLITLTNQTIVVEGDSIEGGWFRRSDTFHKTGGGLFPSAGTLTTMTSGIGPINPPGAFNGYRFYAWGSTIEVCSGTPPQALIASTTNQKLCINVSNYQPIINPATISPATGITYQWMQSTTPGGPYTNVTVGTGLTTVAPTITSSVAGKLYYILKVVCKESGSSIISQEDTVDYLGGTISANPNFFCGVGGKSTLTLTASAPVTSVSWSTINGNGTNIVSPNMMVDTAELTTQTSDFQALVDFGGGNMCPVEYSVGVYDLPTATLTTSANGVCPGTSLTINSGLSAGNFSVLSIPFKPFTIPTNAKTLSANGLAVVPLSGGSMDDGGWAGIPIGFNYNYFGKTYSTIAAGTNGLLMFGTVPGYGTGAGQLGQFTFNGPPVFPNATNPGNIIALMAGDQFFGTPGAGTATSELKYWNEGVAPNRKFVILYKNVNRCCGNTQPAFTARAILYETIGVVEIHIDSNKQGNGSFSNTIGLQDSTKTIGAIAPARSGVFNINTPEAWRFLPPSNYRTQWFGNFVRLDSGTNIFTRTYSPPSTTLYHISYTNLTTGCANDTSKARLNVDILSSGVPAGAGVYSNTNPTCVNSIFKLGLNFAGLRDAMVFSWWKSTNGGATWDSITDGATDSVLFTSISVPTRFKIKISRCGGSGFTSDILVNTINPTPTSVSSQVICGIKGIFTLGATKSNVNDSIFWYNDSTSQVFQKITEGPLFTTPLISQKDTLWVEQTSYSNMLTGQGDLVQPVTPVTATEHGIYIRADRPFTIKTADYYSNVPAVTNFATIRLADSATGTTIYGPFNVSIDQPAAGWYKMLLNIKIPQAGSYQLLASFSQSVNRHQVFSSYPMSMGTYGTITNGVSFGAPNSSTYSYFHNLEIGDVCRGNRVPVVASFQTPPALTLASDKDSVCSGTSTGAIMLSSPTTTYQVYNWTPSLNIAGNETIGYTFSETTAGNHCYTLEGQQTSGAMCFNEDTFCLKVKQMPDAILKLPNTPFIDICNGSVQQFTGSSGVNVNTNVGNGTTSNATDGHNIINPNWHDNHVQHLYLASELAAIGLKPGVIDTLRYNVMTVASTITSYNVIIKMALVPNTSLSTSSYLIPASLQTVYTNSAMPLPAVGPLNIKIAPINWDGVSNILVEVCQNNTAFNGSIGFQFTNTPFNSVFGTFQDNQLSDCATNLTTIGIFTRRPNLRFVQNNQSQMTYSPLTSLYNNAGATVSYTGTPQNTVFMGPNDTTKYYMTATHPNGCQLKDSININVKDTVHITQQPISFASYCLLDTIKLTASATSTSPILRQWQHFVTGSGWVDVTGATSDTLIIPTTSTADSGLYRILFKTGNPCSDRSSTTCNVKVRENIVITQQPVGDTICLGSPFSMTSTAQQDSSRIWVKLTNTTVGTSSNTYSVSNSAYTDSGRYYISYLPYSPCKVKNSDTVPIKVLPPAVITASPKGLTILGLNMCTTLTTTSTGALCKQWTKNGVPIPGATADTLKVCANSYNDSGVYRLIICAPKGCIADTTSKDSGVIKVNPPVVITVPPAALSFVCQNSTFTATLTATNATGYQWYKDGTIITGNPTATTNTLIINNVQVADSGKYVCQIVGQIPYTPIFSTGDTLYVTTLAKITTIPSPFKVCELQAFNMTGAATNAVGYNWTLNGTSLSLNNVTKSSASALITDSGAYQFIAISGMAGATQCINDTSAAINDTVVRQIQITTQPNSKTFVCQNSAFNTSLVANYATGYQWQKNGTNVATGGTTASYTIASTQPADSGNYTVVLTGNGPCPNKTTTIDTLKVTKLAVIGLPLPSAFTVCELQSNVMTGVSSNAIAHNWMLNGVSKSKDSLKYTISSAAMSDSGAYRFIAISGMAGATQCKNDTSVDIAGNVIRQIQIMTQPSIMTQVCDKNAFSASITANYVSTYQWKKAGTNVSNGTGGTTSNYGINPVALADAGNYTVEMTGTAPCPNKISVVDTLKVTPLAKIAVQPNATTVCKNSNMSFTVGANNAITYQWFKNGTAIPTQTSNTLTITSAGYSDSARYKCVAYSADGCKPDTSTEVLGAVMHPIENVVQAPASSYGCIGANFKIKVSADNVAAYDWKLNGSSIGQSTDSMTRTPFTIADTGNYTVFMTAFAPCPNQTSANAVILPTTAAFITTEPVNTNVCLGNTLKLKVVSEATTGYQWKKNGVNMPSETNDSLVIPNMQASNDAIYSVVCFAYNGCTNDTSVLADVQTRTPLSVTTPIGASYVHCENTTDISLTTAVAGSGPYSYSWTLNGAAVGTNSANFIKAAAGVTTADSGKYSVKISGDTACPSIMDSSIVDINKAPVITTQPNGPSVICIGQTLKISTVAENYSSIEWFRAGGGSTGQIQDTFSKVTANSDAGSYYAVVNPLPMCSSVTSSNYSVVVNSPAKFLTSPQGKELVDSNFESYTMNCLAGGTGPFTYQWFKSGVAISGATNTTYTINNYIAAKDSGNYTVAITSGAPCSNTVTSSPVKVTTVRCTRIETQPIPMVNLCEGPNAKFSLNVKAISAKGYQWYKDGVSINGATFPNYTVFNAKASQSGVYRCRVFSFDEVNCGLTLTDSVIVTIKQMPTVTTQPKTNTSCGSSQHTMSVTATYAENYQWYRNGISIAPNGTNQSYVYSNVNLTGDVFYCLVSNNLCPATKSDSIKVKTIVPTNQVYLASKSTYNMVERCTDANGWTYYANHATSDSLLFAIRKNDTGLKATPSIVLMNGIKEISPVNIENRGMILGSRIFTLPFSRSITKAYDVKFYYSQLEESLVMNRFRDIRTAEGSKFSTFQKDTIAFITTTQRLLTSQLYNNLTIPLNISNTIAIADKEFGSDNGVKYVAIKKLVSQNTGGTMFMDYFITASSGVSNAQIGLGFNLYPVPTNDGKVTVEVTSKKMKPLRFTITDMTGRTIAVFDDSHHSESSTHVFDFSNLANGNYQMVVTNDEETNTGRFTISQ